MDDRMGLCIEGVPTMDGRLVERGALEGDADGYPPVYTSGPEGWDAAVVGKAWDVRRDGDVVSARVVLDNRAAPEYLSLDRVNAHLEVALVDHGPYTPGERFVVKRARLNGVFLSSQQGGWPNLDRRLPRPAEERLAALRVAARAVVGDHCESHAEPSHECDVCCLLNMLDGEDRDRG